MAGGRGVDGHCVTDAMSLEESKVPEWDGVDIRATRKMQSAPPTATATPNSLNGKRFPHRQSQGKVIVGKF